MTSKGSQIVFTHKESDAYKILMDRSIHQNIHTQNDEMIINIGCQAKNVKLSPSKCF